MSILPNALLQSVQVLFTRARTVSFNFSQQDTEVFNNLFRTLSAGYVNTFFSPFIDFILSRNKTMNVFFGAFENNSVMATTVIYSN